MDRPIAFISGGSSGIGFACAAALVRRGWHVVIAARTAILLESAKLALGNVHVTTMVVDVADNAACVEAVATVECDIGPIALLITSAGICVPGELSTQDLATHRRHFDVNYFGTLQLVHAVVPFMRHRRRGHIVLVSSAAAFVGIYGYAAYAPTKFAVRGLAETLRAELDVDGISVAIAYPPDTDTPQYANEQLTKPAATKAITAGGGLYAADVVGERIVERALRGDFAITQGPTLWVLRWWHSLIGPLFLRHQQRLARRRSAS